MQVKIHGGTASGDASSLCHSCRYATIVRGSSVSEEVIECSRISDDHRITFAVKFCNKVGFVRPQDMLIQLPHRLRDE